MMWNEITDLKIKQIKIAIIKKKLMLSFIVDEYAWWDTLVRWSQFLILLISPIVAFISMFVKDRETITVIIVVLNGMSIGIVKLKDYLGYDKIRDNSKEQTINYGKLYDFIDRELLKNTEQRQDASEFINFINQEYYNVSKKDTELSYSDSNKFKEFCRNNNIPFDEDMVLLKKLIDGSRAELRRRSMVISDKPLEQIDEKHVIDVTPEVSEESTYEPPEYHQVLSEISNPKTFNSKKDIKWAMSRLESLETNPNFDQQISS